MKPKPRISKAEDGWQVERPRVGFGAAEVRGGFPSREAAGGSMAGDHPMSWRHGRRGGHAASGPPITVEDLPTLAEPDPDRDRPLSGRFVPKPYTWAEFEREWNIACIDAFEVDAASAFRMAAALPHQLFPHVTEIQNPATGQWVEIRRYSWSAFRVAP